MLLNSIAVSGVISGLMFARSRLPHRTKPSIKGSIEGLCVVAAGIYIIGWAVMSSNVINNKIIS